MLYADQRWIGDHGIGRFARMVLSSLHYTPIPLNTSPSSPFDMCRTSWALRELTSNDLFFSPGYNAPFACRGRFVFTMHDLNHIDTEEGGGIAERIYYATFMKRSCHHAAKILTVSEFSRSRIAEWSGVPIEKIVTVGCGVNAQFNPEVAPYDFPFPYLLCVSNRRAHKNEFRTVEAFAKACPEGDIRLIFTGKPTQDLMEHIRRNRVEERVHFAGTVPDELLPSLYRSAQALLFVSLYEGFGLPLLEAMACGTPVVTSNTSSLPEIAGGAALLVDPLRVDEIVAAIDRVLSDTMLRQQLRAKGIAQATRYPWEATIEKVQRVLSGGAFGTSQPTS